MEKIALVTGANRGIGFEVVRQLAKKGITVLLGSRDLPKGLEAQKALEKEGLSVLVQPLEIRDPQSIRQLADALQAKFGRLDILVNNAGAHYDYGVTPLATDLNYFRQALENNLLGAWATTQALMPLLRKSPSARVVNVSSGAGSYGDPSFGLGTMGGGVASYGLSKLALNGLTVKLAAELKDSKILVNAVCPGFTATYPGAKENGARPVEEGAASVVWAALIPDDGPTGGFFRDGKAIPW